MYTKVNLHEIMTKQTDRPHGRAINNYFTTTKPAGFHFPAIIINGRLWNICPVHPASIQLLFGILE